MKGLTMLAALVAALGLWFYQRVLRPLRLLAVNARRLSQGDFTALETQCGGAAEIDTLRLAMNAMVGHVRRAQAQERSYIEALSNGQEAERARIARELHDDTTQALIAIAQSVELAQALLPGDSPALPMLQTARGQALQSVDNLRRIIANLRPPILAELGLGPALHMLAEGSSGAAVQVEIIGRARRLSETRELVLFRSAQEAVWNAIRHGGAQQIHIHLSYEASATHLSIEDDGSGFEVPAELRQLAAAGHYGLLGISERLEHLAGRLEISSQPGQGTRIDIVLPNAESPQPGDLVRDPVCSALILPQQAYSSLLYQGQRYYFCCPVCEGAFQARPEVYLQGGAAPA